MRHLHKIMMGFCSKHVGWVSTSALLMILNFPIELILLSYLSGRIFVNMADIGTKYARVVKLIIYFFLAYFVIELSLAIREYYDAQTVQELEKEVRNKMIEMILEKNEIGFDQLETGEMVARFLKVPIHTYYTYGVISKHIVPFLIAIFCLAIYVLFLNWRIGLVFIAVYGVHMMVLALLCRTMMKESEQKMVSEMKMFNKLDDTLSNMHTIFTSDTIEKEKKYMTNVQDEFIGVYKSELKMNAGIKTIISMCSLTAIIAVFLFSVYIFRKNLISKEKLIALVTLLLFLCRFVGYTSRRILDGMITIGSVMESNSFIDQLRRDTFMDGPRTDFIKEGAIEFRGVTFRYNKDKDSPAIFSNFSVTIPARSKVLLVGDSGSGKTTFLRLLLGFFDLDSGTILIDGVDVRESKRSYLRSKIGYINQTTRLFDRSIMDNILYGTSCKTREDAEKLLHENQLMGMFAKLDLDAMAGKHGENLSGGMRQIVLMMRCCLRDCPIVILDEATSNIDKEHRVYVNRLIDRLSRDRTVIMVSHDPGNTVFDTTIQFG
jgi:ATP-binding cassette subfamily B protein/ATP-binding cassette subfamily B multidrug efflux pump